MKKQDRSKVPARPLALARERVRSLDVRELAHAAGGIFYDGWIATPSGQ
jgi:hypothetical protein